VKNKLRVPDTQAERFGLRRKRRLGIRPLVLLAIAVLFFAGPSTAATPTYTITDLGTFGGTFSGAYGINDSGQVVGYAYTTGDTAYHGFLYSGGVLHDLGTLGGPYSWAFGINNSGQVVGWSYTTDAYSPHAFLYSGGVLHDLGTLGGSFSEGHGINDSEDVVGWSDTTGDATRRAFLYSGGIMHDLGTLGGSNSWAYAINDFGKIAGEAFKSGDTASHAFLYSGGTMTDLGTLGGDSSVAYGVNDGGQVVGGAQHTPSFAATHAFLYSGGVMHDLGTLGGQFAYAYAYGINNSGLVVGVAETDTGPTGNHAFFYSGGVMTDLNDLLSSGSGWELTEAQAINNSGQIVGTGFIGGQPHAFLMTPTGGAWIRFPLDGAWAPIRQKVGDWYPTYLGYHLAHDVGRQAGTPVYPMMDGIIKYARVVATVGCAVHIEHQLPPGDPLGGKVVSVYYHLKRPNTKSKIGDICLPEGQPPPKNQPLGYVSGLKADYGTGPHLHFGIRKGPYNVGCDPRTKKWYYPGYTTIYKGSCQKPGQKDNNPQNPVHKLILGDWISDPEDFIRSRGGQ
jgi:probable HAF family extracellular repeat protein